MKPTEILAQMAGSGHATGPDLSKWNVSFDLDEAPEDSALAQDVVDLVDARVSVAYSNGGVEIDPLWEKIYTEMEEHPDKVRMGYAFLNKSEPWTVQYDKFLEAIDGKELEILEADAEHHHLYNNLTDNWRDAERFAGITYYFLAQLEKDFPGKIAMLYTNYPTYVLLRQYYPALDRFALHYARFPYSYWYNLPSHWEPSFRAWVMSVFSGEAQPVLPPTRMPTDWDIWQLGDHTGLGYELGVSGSDNIDINISRRKLEEFREWSGLYKRWPPVGHEPEEHDLAWLIKIHEQPELHP